MSSGRESVGDLIPPDMLQVFSEDRQGGRGKRGGRRAGSIRRAFKWFKSQRRKTRRRAKEIRGDLLAQGSPVELPQSTPNTAGTKEEVVGTVALQDFQENVFVEGNRTKYVMDLHTEAQQGLKMQQLENDSNGVDYPDDHSMISTVTAQTEDSMAFSELRGFESESTAADSVSMRSSISSRSTRSGLKRQASTFRPLKPDRTEEKTKSRRKHMRTVVGIPRHIQRELGLDRAAWIATNPLDGQLSNGDMILPAIITTMDGSSTSSDQESVKDLLQGKLKLHKVKEDNTRLLTLAKPKEDILPGPTIHSVDPEMPGADTLDVPGTENPTGAVMSISPQATYLSKIIPNAVLPPSVDVVELSRSRSRSSVRTVSKSSLVSASPASTRSSSRVSSHRSTTRSNYSGWSHSGSSETLVSDSSTISSSSTLASRGSQVERPAKMNNHSELKTTHVNGDSKQREDNKKIGSSSGFTRNLSVMKRSKLPPTPPSRSHSLHNRKHTWKMDPSILDDVSIPDGSPYPNVISVSEMKVNPKSYLPSSNELATKEILPGSTDKKTMAVGTSHSKINGTSKLAELRNSLQKSKNLIYAKNPSPAVIALWSLIEIPAHPQVLAPPAPPPETWAHNQHSFELLCGPGPVNYTRWAKMRGLKIDEPEVALANSDTASELQPMKLNGKVESLAQATCIAPSPSPPPEHCPPTPIINKPKHTPPPLNFAPSTPTLAAKAIKDLTSWIPPPPLFPPPAPPVGVSSPAPVPASVIVPNDNDFPPPPPPFSPRSLLTMPQIPPDIPPPPPQAVPPPPPSQAVPTPPPSQAVPPPPPSQAVPPPPPSQAVPPPPPSQAVPPPPPSQVVPPPPPSQVVPPPPPPSEPQKSTEKSPPQESQPLTQNILIKSSLPSQQISIPPPPQLPTDERFQQVNVPRPPPLPTEVNMEDSLKTKETEKRTNSPSPPKEETSSPMVTQSLLQMVRLRSVKSNQNQAVDLSKPSQPKPNQEAPPKPIRRSLIMTSLPPDLEALSSTEPKTESPSITVHTNTTTVLKTHNGTSEIETHSNNIVQKAQDTRLEPTCSEDTTPTTKPTNTSGPTESVTKQPSAQPELKPQSFKEQVQPSVPLQSTTDLKDQPNNDPKPQPQAQEPTKTPHTSEKQSSTVEKPSRMNVEEPKTQTPILNSTPPVASPPANHSMRLQDAIRLKAAAMSTNNSQTKRFGLRSPPPVVAGGATVPNSPASTASFIFSKSPKKVVIETPSSIEVQSGLRKTLVAELASVSESAKSSNSHKTANKAPPPIAKKPNGKVENIVQNSAEANSAGNSEQTETVQTAGQEVQTENSERTTKE